MKSAALERAACALTLALLAGCANLTVQEGNPWLLPPLEGPLDEPVDGPSTTAVLGSAVPSQPPGALSLADVLSSVERSYPLLEAAEQRRVVAAARQLEALGAFDLKLGGKARWKLDGFYENHFADVYAEQRTGLWGVSVLGGYRLGRGNFDPTYDGKPVTNYGGEARVGVSLPLLQGGAFDPARAKLEKSSLDRALAARDLRAIQVELAQAATYAYWSWATAGASLRVAEDLLSIAEERQRAIDVRVERGDLPAIEALDNRRLVAKRLSERVAAQRYLEQAALKLSLFWRDADGRREQPLPSQLPRSLPAPSPLNESRLAEDLRLAAARRPELAMLRLKRRKLEVERRLAENDLLPRLDVAVLASGDFNDDPVKSKGEFEVEGALSFSFPVQQRKARGRLAAAEAELRELSAEGRYKQDAIEVEVLDALSAVRNSYRKLVQVREAARLTSQLAVAERRRFELGASTILVLNLREKSAAEAAIDVIEGTAMYWLSVSAYRAAVGLALEVDAK